MRTCLIDSDVIINWLTKEEDISTDSKLWEAPHKIMTLIEDRKINGYTTLLNLMEIRFVLRRKKEMMEDNIAEDIDKLSELLEIAIPDEVNLLASNNLQRGSPLSPFDAILIAVGLSLPETTFITRDKNLLKISSDFLDTSTPEEFIKSFSI